MSSTAADAQTTPGASPPRKTAPARRSGEDRGLLDRIPNSIQVAALGAILLGLWQLIVILEFTPPILLPSPVATGRELWLSLINIFSGDYILEALWTTTQEILLGFALAAAIGFFFGVVVGETKFGARVVMPYIVAVNVAPKVAFAPLFVAWLGFGLSAKVALAAFIGFFPMTVDTAAGLVAADRNHLSLFRSLRASRWQTLWKLKLPAAAPYMFAGLKTAAVFSVIGVIVVEYLTGGGIGELIKISASQLRIDRLLAFVIILSVVGLILFKAVALVERLLIRWRQPDMGFIERGIGV